VLVANPAMANPFADASEITITGRDRGKFSLASGYASHGEDVRLVRGRSGKVTELWLGGGQWLPEARLAAEMKGRYAKKR